MDIGFRANVDPARRLVKNKNVALRRKPLGKNDFLLVPPDSPATDTFTLGARMGRRSK